MKDLLIDRIPHDPDVTRGRVELHPTVEPEIRSQALDWPGLLAEAGRNHVVSVERIALAHHYVGVNAGPEPITLHGVTDGGPPRDLVVQPGEAWVTPAGRPISLRAEPDRLYVRITIEPRLLALDGDRLPEIRLMHGIDSPPLRHLISTVLAEADARNPGGLAFVETLARAVGQQIALHAGEAPRLVVHQGGLSPRARKQVLDLIDQELDSSLSISRLAREADLSPAHFAHAFKRSLGAPPHRYLMRVRLERARRMLVEPGARLSDVALRAGFADQAHFTRLFKRHFGITPGALLRTGVK